MRRMALEYIDITDDKYKPNKKQTKGTQKMTQHELDRKALKENKKVTEMTTANILWFLVTKHKFFLMTLYAATITSVLITRTF